MLLALAVLMAAAALFLLLAANLHHSSLRSIDEHLLLALRTPGDPADPIGPRWLESVVRDVTALGSRFVLTFVVLAVTGFLALAGRGRRALAVLAFTVAGALLGETAKLGFGRPRPELVAHAVDVVSLSFPSAHAMQSSVVYLTLGALLARGQPRRALRAYVMGIAVLLAVMVGASRVYLGVHWPSDVVAGWSLGTAWAMACWVADRMWRRRTSAHRAID
ncbi:MAG: phosphatase PAP2 family protein [Hyphomicrobiaceae bacterium]